MGGHTPPQRYAETFGRKGFRQVTGRYRGTPYRRDGPRYVPTPTSKDKVRESPPSDPDETLYIILGLVRDFLRYSNSVETPNVSVTLETCGTGTLIV